ncbi:16S rRNA (cytosine(967)-C(5))-methyltransferase RsmB [Anaerococcus sp. AGMB00486]|uniref:16S rRNA (Cytosine(967)-C(5))-methyltransferase RsmB n=1 Tax=Anaerococcus faecalis TaxID=2742993 RepID=A0ABX2N906_9FIRM|nr:16S rRNA (cytosine(967)-C(5))-methyltransferase RsmB [Anaerococcus faecalis]NVF11039.1 16S rRNA (cytosine(967)-C(5))-methyltransferase RsmB [Anaerococcus faecalis]
MDDFKLIIDGLYEVFYENKKSTDILNKIASKREDISYITRSIYGVIERKLYLDYIISKLSKIKIKKLDKKVLLILEVGIYNIHFLDRKNYAIVNELVNVTKKESNKSKGFVNAILRSFIRDEENLSKINIKNEYEYLSIKYSCPIWIIEYLNLSYDEDFTKKFLLSLNDKRFISIRVNNKKISKDDLKKILIKRGYKVSDSKISKLSLRITNPSKLASTNEFKAGLFTIQSEASIKVCEELNPKERSNILDLCAAPGTKTSLIGELVNNNANIFANDISFNKLSKINENIERLNLKNIEITNFDASEYIAEYKEKFDYVLCDLPCSGLGVMDRKPEIRYNRDMDGVKKLASLQKRILDRAFMYLKKGGILLYSTCTLGMYENLDNYIYLTKKKRLKNIAIDDKPYIEYTPFEDNTDGFFMTKFEKI